VEEKKADVLIALGECSMADDKFETALVDLQKALDIRKKLCDSNSRLLAEVYYHLGQTYKNLNDFANAACYFELASNSIKGAIESTNGESVESLIKIKDELDELVQDAKDSDNAMKEKLFLFQKFLSSSLGNNANLSSGNKGQEANDITNLVRKTVKRAANDIDGSSISLKNNGTENIQSDLSNTKKNKNVPSDQMD